jgi:hypothetical protein
MGGVQVAGLPPLAVDMVLLDQPADQVGGVGLPLDQPQGPGLAQHPAHARDRVEVEGRSAVAGVAARATITDFLGLQHDRAYALGRQVQGGREAGIAGADNADIGVDVPLQRPQIGCRGGGGVPERGLERGTAQGAVSERRRFRRRPALA